MKKYNSAITMMMEMCMQTQPMCMAFCAPASDMFSVSEVNSYAA